MWGGRFNASQRIVAVVGGGFTPLNLQSNGALCLLDIWPARLISVIAMATPTTQPAFVADGGTFDGEFIIGIGIGKSRENLVVPFTLAPPYAQVSTMSAGGLPLCVPAKQLTVNATLKGTTSAAGVLAVAFSAYAAPFSLGGLGLPEAGGTQG